MIHYNNPKYQQKRANVKPLSVEENEICIKSVNFLLRGHNDSEPGIKLLQRLIWDYENLQHMRETHESELKSKYNEGFEKGHAYAVNTYIK